MSVAENKKAFNESAIEFTHYLAAEQIATDIQAHNGSVENLRTARKLKKAARRSLIRSEGQWHAAVADPNKL